MSLSALVIQDTTTTRLKSVTMAESNHSGGGSACNGGSDSFKMLEKPASTGKERKLSSSQLELNRCLEAENVSEPLLKQYSCAWHRDGSLLIQGHMYITANYVCFYSSILGWETKLAIKCREIIQIFKQKTALIIPNAISVITLQHEFFFTSFLHRNSAFKVLQCTWKNSMNGISLTKPDLLRQLQSRKERERRGGDGEGSGSNLAVLTTDNEEDQLSTGGSTEDITTRDRRRGGGGGGGGNTTGASSNEQTDDALLNLHVAASHGETTSDETETDSCIHSHSVTSTGSTFTTTDGLEEVGTLRRSLSLVRLNSEEFGVLEETDAAASTPVKDSKSEGLPDISFGSRLTQLVRRREYGVSYSQLINTIIIVLIAILVFSMLVLLCKLSQLDPNLKAWLSWQPWCQVICS